MAELARPASPGSPPHSRWLAGWLVLVLLSSLYLITYRGTFQSIDELAMFSLTESLVQTGTMTTPQLAFAAYHNPVGRLEPLQSLVAAPLYGLAVQSARLGNIETVMLLNVLLTAATGAGIYVLLCGLDYSPRRALLVTLIYGLATIAWPYSRNFFREPLLALLLLGAAAGLIRWQSSRRLGWGLLVLCCLLLALATKVTSALAWPAFGLAILLQPGLSRAARLRRGAVLSGVLLAGGLGVTVLLQARLGAGLLSMLRTTLAGIQPTLMAQRLYGLTLGAGRGLFLFSPVLLLALPGLVLLWRRERGQAILSGATLIALLLGYSSYSSWHGGLVWGSRFLVPVVPLLMLPLAAWWAQARGGWRILSSALGALSLLIQFSAATADSSLQVGAGDWTMLTDYVHSPAVQQVLTWRPSNLDMLWWHSPMPGISGPAHVNGWIVLLPAVSALCAAGLLLAHLNRTLPADPRVRTAAAAWPGLLWLGGLAVLLLSAPHTIPVYPGIDARQVRRVADIVNQDRDQGYVVVTVSNDFHLNVLLDRFKGRFVHHWVSPLQEEGFEPLANPPFPARSLRLVVDRVHMQPDHQTGRGAELWLNAHLHRYFVEWVGEGYQIFSYLYPPADLPLETVDYRWQPGMRVSAVAMTPRTVAPGEPVWLAFHCTADARPQADYDLFVQFLAPDGHFVNGTDGPPQFGAALTSRWKPGETVVDRRAFFVPAGTPPGTYRVIAGFYINGERQVVLNGTGNPLGTHIELGQIEVQP